MISTTLFFIWYFAGLGGIGGWLLFFLITLAAIIYIWFDSTRRILPALPWRLAVSIIGALLLPTIVYRFIPPLSQATLFQYLELIFYLGLVGGIVPAFIALGYYLHFRGMRVCPNGHLYDAADGNCYCQRHKNRGGVSGKEGETQLSGAESKPRRPRAMGIIFLPDDHDFRLFQGITTIGRESTNDLVFNNESVSRDHAKIIEENNVFRLFDLGSKTGTWLNGRMVREPEILESDDVIRFGDDVEVKFISEKLR